MVHKIRMTELMDLNAKAGQYFFSPDTMKFFDSRVGGEAFVKDDKAFFITSEKFSDRLEHISEPRKFTIRSMDMRTGSVSTVGEFQGFSTESQAKKKLRELVE
jgi:hypothetical protein